MPRNDERKLHEANFSVSFPSRHRPNAVDYSSIHKIGRSTSSESGFIENEAKLRAAFEHFLLDLRLNGVFRAPKD